MFQFKQFSVDQAGCAMKINTDGVLLGAIAEADQPATILDIGTGTGVIALMLAQKYPDAKVDAVEIDPDAARTAEKNFTGSPFAGRLKVFPMGFDEYFELHPEIKYDLIISNPPFYIDSLKSPGIKKSLAKHTDADFFERLIDKVAAHFSIRGVCWLVLPLNLVEIATRAAEGQSHCVQNRVLIRSYPDSAPHRAVLGFSRIQTPFIQSDLSIYASKGVYSEGYKELLQPYFIAF